MGDSSARVHAGEELKVLVPSHGARRVGRYLLCDQIGSGGMATIHLARLLGPQGFSRTVAVKQLHPQFGQNPQFVAMLLDEARLAVRVRHVNVVSPLDIVATETELFIVMDYVSGESLANLLAESDGPLRPTFAAAIMVQVLLGLHAAHEATREQGDALGLVHRDVSPQNILVGQDGVIRMVDFGIAKAVARTQTTDGGMVKGKLGYMAPEQIRLEAVDRRSDLFSAGVVLWEALTGTGLFVADTLGASIDRILNGEITPPSRLNPAVTPELEVVVLKALARDRDARFQDALSMAAALQRATPVASALEIIDWVEKLAGPELARRAELVKRAEAVRWEPSRASDADDASAPEEPPASGARSGWAATLDAAWRPSHRTPTLLGIAQPLELQAPSSSTGATASVIATKESTGIAVGGDRDASASGSKSRPAWKSWGVALAVVLAGITLAIGVLSVLGADSRDSFSVARRPLGIEPPLTTASSSAVGSVLAGQAPSPVRRELDAREPSPPQVRPVASDTKAASLEAEPASDERQGLASGAAPRARAARPGSNDRSATSGRASAARRSAASKKAESKPRRSETTSNDARARSTRDACDPPWVVNAQQVKVFKAECLR